jgi:hypothetical protein
MKILQMLMFVNRLPARITELVTITLQRTTSLTAHAQLDFLEDSARQVSTKNILYSVSYFFPVCSYRCLQY